MVPATSQPLPTQAAGRRLSLSGAGPQAPQPPPAQAPAAAAAHRGCAAWAAGSPASSFDSLALGTAWVAVSAASLEGARQLEDVCEGVADAEAVILHVAFPHFRACSEAVRVCRQRDRDLPGQLPVVVVLGSVPADADWHEVVGVQRWLLSKGADHVVMEAEEACDLRFAVALALAAGQRERADRQQWEEQLRGELEEQMEERLETRVQERLAEVGNDLFWPHAHKLYGCIPPLDDDLAADPAKGSQVGPCQLGDHLGHGAFGQVWRAANVLTGEMEAVKAVEKSQLDSSQYVRSLHQELAALAKLDHSNVVKLIGSMHGPRHVFIRMELAGSRNIHRMILQAGGQLDVCDARVVHTQLMAALVHCHGRGVAHRDLKPENIAVSDRGLHVKLLDFGCAAEMGEVCHDQVGTMPFMAPEMMVPGRGGYEPSGSDVWASSVVLLEMLCGVNRLPEALRWPADVQPDEQRHAELVGLFRQGPRAVEALLRPDLGHCGDGDLLELLSGCFEVQPLRRWTATQAEESAWLLRRGTSASSALSGEPASPKTPKPRSRRPLPRFENA